MKEVVQLARLRLERDLSYKALAEEMGLAERTVYRILNFPKQNVHERTLFKIRRYLDEQASAERASA